MAQLGSELGPFGATEHGDADTWMLSYQANGIVGVVEAIESDVPAVLLREEPVPETGGPGFNGGGWGDPFTREPERVLIDVRDGYVTASGEARDYGVAVIGDPDEDPEGLVVDEAATARLRAGGEAT